MAYCASRSQTIRRSTVEVKIGAVGVGGTQPVRVQSMTTSNTLDVAATVSQSIALAEVGCEIVRVTAPNVAAAQALRDIRAQFSAAGFAHIPLVADIHFMPQAAMEAVEHVEKIRINPGNYADKKNTGAHEYTDAEYTRELERIHEAVSPLIRRCKELGRALRIGTNHGSLSERIMNRYGDSPLGMVESALEFVRICESNGYHDIVLSMKSSNPKVVIQAYRLLVERMDAAHRPYPLHLGVTEAGDGEDGRIKSAIGIGALLVDGLGDTLRVSLTEDSVHEVPVARALADKALHLWKNTPPRHAQTPADQIDPFHYTRRETESIVLGGHHPCGSNQPPRVIVAARPDATEQPASPALKDTPIEGWLVRVDSPADLTAIAARDGSGLVLELGAAIAPTDLAAQAARLPAGTLLVRRFSEDEAARLGEFAALAATHRWILAVDASAAAVERLVATVPAHPATAWLFTLSNPALDATTGHALGAYRQLAEALRRHQLRAPLWIRNTRATATQPGTDFLSHLLEASLLTGSLLSDGLGDLVSVETVADPVSAAKLAYNILQGAGARISKAEFVACPSCGRTLFDLQTTAKRIRAQTGHLKGVKIAIMGCIVNGPGEMADADFGYVGGAPGKINLYVGRQCVQYNIPQDEADARLIALIREHGKWVDPEGVSKS
ncbi:MAG: (E)-4-hydroxy-3-methylbut-2-enyl-diphosphate synthase [Opitutaceae bacterium]|jgi:(E)-4-hydroxy-3-methylbut-2-enyl-diphosphate synthase|nr:(E)-4-hydroxy-3-methylbut-2-enyl-diphosphate synthase [Opitutaceae bacterium]